MNYNDGENFQKYLPEGWKTPEMPINKILTRYERVNLLQKAMNTGKNLEGLCIMADSEFNLQIDLGNGLRGTIPRREVCMANGEGALPKPGACVSLVNKTVNFKVKSIVEQDSDYMDILLSRKDVQLEAARWLAENIQEGMILRGIVRGMEQYGAFIDVGSGITGLLHIEDISVARIRHPRERFLVGDRIEVLVKSIDYESGRFILSHKELLGTWEDNVKEFAERTTVIAVARAEEKNGIFIELKPNLVGLAEKKPGIQYGQKVSVFIKKIVFPRKKIKLAIVGS